MSDLSRADLLYLLQEAPQALQSELGALLGFDFKPLSGVETQISIQARNPAEQTGEVSFTTSNQQASVHYPVWYIDQYQRSNTQPIQQQRYQPEVQRKRQPQPLSEPLLTTAQLQVLWDRCLAQHHFSQQPDIPGAVKLLSKSQPVIRLPRLKRENSSQETLLFLDRSEHLAPIWKDQLLLALSLQGLLGAENCLVLLMMQAMHGAIRILGRPEHQDWNRALLPESARLVFCTDLGRYSPYQQQQAEWQRYLSELRQMGHQVIVLNPCQQLRPDQDIRQYSLDTAPSRFAWLQSAMVSCLQAKKPRIRQIRQQVAEGNLEDELQLWNHQHRSKQATGPDWRINPAFLQEWLIQAKLQPLQKQKLQQLNAQWRASQQAETVAMEHLLEQVLDSEPKQVDASLLQPVLKQLEAQLSEHTGARYWLQSQQPLLRFLETELEQRKLELPAQWQRLFELSQSLAPLDTDIAGEDINQTEITLTQSNGVLMCTSEPSVTGRALLQCRGPLLNVDTGKMIHPETAIPYGPLRLRSSTAEISLKTLDKPDWAERYWLETEGYYAVHPGQALFHLQAAGPDRPQAQWRCKHNPWPWAAEVGIDEFGVWAILEVKKVLCKLRWIPAGQFMMGSPKSEAGRFDDETQHKVTLTQGFWLGETSCTQALWKAVMGDNPSDEKRDDLPVNNINWNDVQRFCKRLQQIMPGFQAGLPTEAQWEYACRAGSQTAFWWGDEWSDQFGNSDYNMVQESQYPANDFGLKSMSGNVREWCNDYNGIYPEAEVIDPVGPKEGRMRVLRGGSWFSIGHELRSAGRYADEPDFRSVGIGFRLAGGVDPQASQQVFTASHGPWNGPKAGGK